jgi:hypothetical protein
LSPIHLVTVSGHTSSLLAHSNRVIPNSTSASRNSLPVITIPLLDESFHLELADSIRASVIRRHIQPLAVCHGSRGEEDLIVSAAVADKSEQFSRRFPLAISRCLHTASRRTETRVSSVCNKFLLTGLTYAS